MEMSENRQTANTSDIIIIKNVVLKLTSQYTKWLHQRAVNFDKERQPVSS